MMRSPTALARIKAIAAAEGVNPRSVGRMFSFTAQAPDLVGAILDDNWPGPVTLLDVAINPPALWEAAAGAVCALG